MKGTDFVEAENLFGEAKSRLLQGISARPCLMDFKVVQVMKSTELLYTKRFQEIWLARVEPSQDQNQRQQTTQDAVETRESCVNEKIDQFRPPPKLVGSTAAPRRTFPTSS